LRLHQKKKEEMSEYYLADRRAEERARERAEQKERKAPVESQDVKVTLLGDFMFPAGESQGFDPYNSINGRPLSRDAWRGTRHRR
jgi:hypothetical protein